MNYKNIYDSLISKAKNRNLNGYKERHHIIPKCMGGSNDKSNLVDLTPEEHYVAHQLLAKIYPDNHLLAKAAMVMICQRPSNKLYGWVRRRHAKAQSVCQSKSGNSQYGTKWIHNLDIRESRKIKNQDPVPEGWQIGRVIDFDMVIEKNNKKHNNKKLREEKRIAKIEQEREQYREYYKLYRQLGWQEFSEITKYPKSRPNFVMRCKYLLPEFVPQNGKKMR